MMQFEEVKRPRTPDGPHMDETYNLFPESKGPRETITLDMDNQTMDTVHILANYCGLPVERIFEAAFVDMMLKAMLEDKKDGL
jgi:hypothetical protein